MKICSHQITEGYQSKAMYMNYEEQKDCVANYVLYQFKICMQSILRWAMPVADPT